VVFLFSGGCLNDCRADETARRTCMVLGITFTFVELS